MRRVILICLFVLTALNRPQPVTAVDGIDFAVIQPGQPGTAEEAQPVMDELAVYLGERLGTESPLRGIYFNDLKAALAFVDSTPPEWAIVSLDFYTEQGNRLDLTPIASTRPSGFEKDTWRLAVHGDAPDGWQTVQGKVWGTMLFDRRAAACLAFGRSPDALPFRLVGTFRPLKALRATARGKGAGVVLDRMQYEAMKSLPLANKIKIIHTSAELPTSPVVSFGPPDDLMNKLAGVLLEMKDDPEANQLLQLLMTTGFGPPDLALSTVSLGPNGECTP
jgi:hypothetical protein